MPLIACGRCDATLHPGNAAIVRRQPHAGGPAARQQRRVKPQAPHGIHYIGEPEEPPILSEPNPTPWLEVVRGGSAPLVVSMPHTGTELPVTLEPRLRSPWLAHKDTDWWIE